MTDLRELDEVVKEFLVESQDNLDRIDSDLLDLEQGSAEPGLLGSIFRGIHTIKGTCGFLGLSQLEHVAHRGENLLSLLRDGTLSATPAIVDALLQTVDAIRAILGRLEETGEEGNADYSALLTQLERLAAGEDDSAGSQASEDTSESAVETPPAATAEAETTDTGSSDTEAPPAAAPAAVPTPVTEAPHVPTVPTPPVEVAQEASPTPSPATPKAKAQPAEAEGASRSALADTTIRVDVGLLDRVMNLVGELVLARNRILQFAAHVEDSSFANASQQLNLLTTELQEGVMKTRMQPIGNVWNKFPRMVRGLCQSCGKDVELELDGIETELDRTIIEAIKDPLTHAVRNAIDHGIETPDVREAAGKSPRGRLTLRAYHEGGQVNIEVVDDGGGINLARVKERAISRGLVSAERASGLADREIAHLIFHPGFSTAAAVTNVSGRGVGMDVVKTNVEKIGGSVDVSTTLGSGTVLRIKIPLTLAIIPALIVASQGERFAIPQVNLLELVRLEGEQAKSGIERLYGTTLYRLRGEMLPLLFLDEALQLPPRAADELPDVLNIVVLQADNRQFGLVVDAVSDTEEIVVKPLGKELKSLSAFAGATIMGDGRVALILDVIGIAERASLLSHTQHNDFADERDRDKALEGDAVEPLLVFSTAPGNRMAVPLSIVARLEEVDPSTLERASGHLVIQYRGDILPLLDLTGSPMSRWEDGESPLNVVVYVDDTRSVGLVVEEILDTVNEVIEVQHGLRREGTLGAVVIQGRVTDLLDIESVLTGKTAGFFNRGKAA